MTAASIATLAARIARVPEADATPSMPFSLMGLDSVGAIELACAIEESLGVELPPELVCECADAQTLAARVDALRTDRRVEPAVDSFDLMLTDARLPESIRPPAGAAAAPSIALADARRILLTGATGFLGRWIARTLLEESSATLVCMVRGSSSQSAGRLRGSLSSAGVSSRQFADRVEVVQGDLALDSLGLPYSHLDALSDDMDAVCHAGAVVNWVLPYRAMRTPNVIGTRDLLALAARRGLPFHFVSSASVCYSTLAPAVVDERFDALTAIRGLHFGYAQTKAVAEALVRAAAARGLPAAIYRPSFIAGHSATGDYNADDILARTISGCVRMGTAPDLDWTLDCLPVDVVARDVVRSSGRRGVVHVAHGRPRHWRECVLWMRLYGYDVRLVPYHAWLRQLDRETSVDRSHPLAPLRSFFLGRPADAGGLTLPELMLQSTLDPTSPRHRKAPQPDLDAPLLQRYFDAFVARGALAHTPRTGQLTAESEPTLDAAFFSQAIGKPVTDARYLGRLSDHSIISELTAWRSRRPTGLFRYRLHGPASRDRRDVIVKIKPSDETTIAVGEELARVCGDQLGDAYERWRQRIGFVAGHTRELAIYSQRDPRFTRHAPHVLGTAADATAQTWTIVLERIRGAVLQDVVDRPELWRPRHIECAIDGLAALQSIWFGREAALRAAPWIGYVPSTHDVAEMSDLWSALAAHAAPRFSAWADPAIGSIQRGLIEDVERWWRALETLPRTLVHNDFTPRNICLRENADGLALCAYDWELAAIGAPQHDLAELLCFVLPPDAPREAVRHWIEHHRVALERATGTSLDPADWQLGFRASLCDLMLNRFPMYALVHRVRSQSFLPRVVRAWRRIYELC